MRPGDVEDRDLIVRALAGHREAFGELVCRHQQPVFGITNRIVGGDREVAREIAQETFLRAYRALGRFDLERPFSPWLHRIATNQSLKWVARQRVATVPLAQDGEHELRLPNGTPSPEALMVQAECHARLWDEVSALPPEFRDVILLRHGQQLSYEEIARKLDVPLSSVKSRLYRGRRLLRERLTGEDGP